MILILPQLDQAPLYNAFDLTQPITSNTPNGSVATKNNQTARGTNLAVMLCPSDTYNRQQFNGSTSPSGQTSNFADGWARGDYGANAALGLMTNGGANGFYDAADLTRSTGGWNGAGGRYIRGIMGANASVSIDGITDGASNTILLGEIRAGITSYDCRGIWAMSGGPGASGATAISATTTARIATPSWPTIQRAAATCGPPWEAAPTCAGGHGLLPRLHGRQRNRCPEHAPRRRQHLFRRRLCPLDQRLHPVGRASQHLAAAGRHHGVPPPQFLGVWDKLNLSSDGFPIDASVFDAEIRRSRSD